MNDVHIEVPEEVSGPGCRIVGLLIADVENDQMHICPVMTGCTKEEALAMIAKFLPEVSEWPPSSPRRGLGRP